MYAHYDQDGYFVNLLSLDDRQEAEFIFQKNNLEGEVRKITVKEYRIILSDLTQRRRERIATLARNTRELVEA